MSVKANFRLLRDLIMVYPIKGKQQSDTGIIITSVDPATPIEGCVIAVGPDVKGIEHGDIVVFIKSEHREIKYEKDTFLVIQQKDVLCKIKDS